MHHPGNTGVISYIRLVGMMKTLRDVSWVITLG